MELSSFRIAVISLAIVVVGALAWWIGLNVWEGEHPCCWFAGCVGVIR